MKRLLAALALGVLAPMPALADFSGDYAPANWACEVTPAQGHGECSIVNGILGVTGFNSGQLDQLTTMTTTAPASGEVSYSWFYSSPTISSFNRFFYEINGSRFYIIGMFPGVELAGWGTGSFSVAQGDRFGFGIGSVMGGSGWGSGGIENFSGPTPSVPEPASIALLGVGLIGAALVRRRRTRQSRSIALDRPRRQRRA